MITEVTLSTVGLYDPNHKFIASVNFYQFAAARAYICDNNLEGYYIKHDGMIFPIDKNGRMEKWPTNVLEEYDEILNRILFKRSADEQ